MGQIGRYFWGLFNPKICQIDAVQKWSRTPPADEAAAAEIGRWGGG